MKFSSISPFLGSSYKMTNENVRFFSSFFRGFREGSYQKEGFSYRLGYLIDKKEY